MCQTDMAKARIKNNYILSTELQNSHDWPMNKVNLSQNTQQDGTKVNSTKQLYFYSLVNFP